MSLIGYARVSTSDQDMRLQLDALRGAGCLDEQIFLDTASGTRTSRPGLDACVALERNGFFSSADAGVASSEVSKAPTTGTDGHWVIKLIDVHPDEEADA